MTPRPRRRLRSGELATLITIGILGLILVTGNARGLLRILYSPTAGLIAVVMLVEYILLKGADRSALYRRELDAARSKRREDLLALREMEERIVELRESLNHEGGTEERPPGERRTIEELDGLLEKLRSRI